MVDFNEIFNNKEKVDIEVKAAQGGIPSSVWATYSSFANTFGGTIILGIAEDKETKEFIPVGVENPDKLITEIWNTLNNLQKISANILLDRQVYAQEYEGKKYIVIEVPRANRQDKPVYVGADMFRGSYRRNHEGDYHCTKEEVRAMVRDQSDTSVDTLVLDDVKMTALNPDSIKSYRNRFNIEKENHVWNSLPTEEFLLKIGAARIAEVDGKIHPTLGGLIFFGNYIDISDVLPNFFLDYREKLKTDTRWTDRICSGDGDWSGNVYDFYFKVIDRLTSDVKKPFKINDQLLREDDTPVHKSLREAFANALIHADYHGRRGVVIEKEFRTIKIANPGIFRVNVADAIAGGLSDTRNTRIFNFFSLIKVGERSGMGLCNLYHVWEENGFPQPTIKETIEPDRITITLQIDATQNDNSGAKSGANEKNGVNIGAKETKVLEYVKQNATATSSNISIELSIPLRTVQRILTKLQKDGFLRNDGDRKSCRWTVLE